MRRAWTLGTGRDNIGTYMKTISVMVLEEEYEAFRRAARHQGRPVAQLIREAMALYRAERIERAGRLEEVPVLPGHRPKGPLPTREELYDEVFGR
jgi:hypothetical protein